MLSHFQNWLFLPQLIKLEVSRGVWKRNSPPQKDLWDRCVSSNNIRFNHGCWNLHTSHIKSSLFAYDDKNKISPYTELFLFSTWKWFAETFSFQYPFKLTILCFMISYFNFNMHTHLNWVSQALSNGMRHVNSVHSIFVHYIHPRMTFCVAQSTWQVFFVQTPWNSISFYQSSALGQLPFISMSVAQEKLPVIVPTAFE